MTQRSPMRRLFTLITAAVGAVALAAVGVGVFIVSDLAGAIQNNAVNIGTTTKPPAAELKAYDGAFNLLVVGTDECADSIRDFIGVDRCSGDEATHQLNDVNILIHVSEEPRRVTVLSFPRDLYTEIPGGEACSVEGTAKINTAYMSGGLACVKAAVDQLTGLNVDYAAKLSFLNVMQITDAIGGVEVCVGAGGIHDANTRVDLDPGMHKVKGGDALQFLRTRYGLSGESDIARISNQQQYMSRLVNKLRSEEVLTNPVTLLNLATIVAHNMEPSKELADPVRMAQLALTIKDVPSDAITFVTFPVYDVSDGLAASGDEADQLLTAIKNNEVFTLSRTGVGTTDPNAADPSEEPTTEDPVTEDPTPDPGSTTVPSTKPVELGWGASGQTAAQETCSNGNG
ncbi:LCP family protein [Microbacterium gorillae]|uniref:LCP family protein n=1 Tax=Microbacterium gorillae TaxID=1231063 RepID=UPI000693C5BB|nr:LCP family protein [Microbacterium gorillae]